MLLRNILAPCRRFSVDYHVRDFANVTVTALLTDAKGSCTFDKEGVTVEMNVEEACEALGVSWDFWKEYVAPEVRMVRRGRRKLIAVAELERWLERNAEAMRDG